MSENASDSHSELTFSAARRAVLGAVQSLRGSLHDPRFSDLLLDPSRDATFSDLEFDSLTAIEMCMLIEDSLGVPLDPADLVTYSSVNSLAAHISAHLPARTIGD